MFASEDGKQPWYLDCGPPDGALFFSQHHWYLEEPQDRVAFAETDRVRDHPSILVREVLWTSSSTSLGHPAVAHCRIVPPPRGLEKVAGFNGSKS